MRGDRLKQARTELGHTQESLAELINSDTKQVWRWETGETEPKADMVARLAQSLSVSTDWLLGLTDDNSPRDMALSDLSTIERSAISAWRKGNKLAAIAVIVSDGKAMVG